MAFSAILTPDDLKKGDLIAAGWHPAEITGYEEGEAGDEAKNPGSTNCIFTFTIIDGPEKGKNCVRYLNETALGFGKNLYAAVGLPKNPDGGYTLNSDVFKQFLTRKIKIYVARGKNPKTKKEFNDVQDFAPLS